MKYAITYTLDNTWDGVDTLLVETDTCPLDMPPEQLADIFEAYTHDRPSAEWVVEEKMWFVRNVEDTDVDNRGNK